MLPERKSKIATLLKQDGQAYCICRSSDSSRFMMWVKKKKTKTKTQKQTKVNKWTNE